MLLTGHDGHMQDEPSVWFNLCAAFAAVASLQMVPFLLEDKLKELGAEFSRAADWAEYVVTDGNLITGQNPGGDAGMLLQFDNPPMHRWWWSMHGRCPTPEAP